MSLLSLIRTYTLKTSIVDSYQGIAIANLSMNDKENTEFNNYVKQALKLIEAVDPRRYRRVQAEISYLVNTSLISMGDYERKNKRCNLDYSRIVSRWKAAGEGCLVAYIACVIVHEATHGRIYSYGIPYKKEYWLRIERLCRWEEFLFARRLQHHCWCSESLALPIDEESLIAYLSQSRWSLMKARYARLKQAFRDSKK